MWEAAGNFFPVPAAESETLKTRHIDLPLLGSLRRTLGADTWHAETLRADTWHADTRHA